MSRIEKGQTLIDPLLLQKVSTVLGIDREGLLRLVDRGVNRTHEAARQTLRLAVKDSWEGLQKGAGQPGAAGLVTFAVSLALAE